MKIKNLNNELVEVTTNPVITESRFPQAAISRLGEMKILDAYSIKDQLKALGFKFEPYAKQYVKRFASKEELLRIIESIKEIVAFPYEVVEKIPVQGLVVYQPAGSPSRCELWKREPGA